MMADNLSRDAAAARAAGMTYGRWKALQDEQPKAEKGLPDGWKECAFCGKPFKQNLNQKYCDILCSKRAYRAKKKRM